MPPPEVALENKAKATLMAIAMRLDVLNGSSSYIGIKNKVYKIDYIVYCYKHIVFFLFKLFFFGEIWPM